MSRTTRRNTGAGLVAAGLFLAAVFLVKESGGEPSGALAPIAAVFLVLGLKALWRRPDRAEPSAPRET